MGTSAVNMGIGVAGIILLALAIGTVYMYVIGAPISQLGVHPCYSCTPLQAGVVRVDCPQLNILQNIAGDKVTIAEGHVFPSGLHPMLPLNVPSLEEAKTPKEAEKIYFNYVDTVQVECMARRRFGQMSDVGLDMCLVPLYSPQYNKCIVYSFGISGDWSYDDAIAEIFGCEGHAYDPTIKLKEHRRGQHIHFHPVGLYGEHTHLTIKNESYLVNTLEYFVIQNGHQGRVIDMVKFDIDGAEWSAIPNMVESGQLKHVKQIAFESHTSHSTLLLVERYNYFIDILEQLQTAGFRRWHSNLNQFQIFKGGNERHYSSCQEVYYININFLEDA